MVTGNHVTHLSFVHAMLPSQGRSWSEDPGQIRHHALVIKYLRFYEIPVLHVVDTHLRGVAVTATTIIGKDVGEFFLGIL